jgi:mono/diheme cytochrome c family protein
VSKAIVYVLFIVALAAAIAVPTLVTVENKSSAATLGLGGKELTAEAAKGRQLFAERCVVCHALKAAGSVGAIGPNLDVHVGLQTKSYAEKRELVLSAISEGRDEAEGTMPADLYVGKEAEEVAAFVSQAASPKVGKEVEALATKK